MSVIVAHPPNFGQILAAFPDADKPGVIFAFGENIYAPSGDTIPPALLAHEGVHCERQCMSTYGTDPERWWDRYIKYPEFRYNEELLAHAAEFKAQDHRGLDRNIRAKILQSTAARLCAPLYNYQPPRTLSVAMRDLRWQLEQR